MPIEGQQPFPTEPATVTFLQGKVTKKSLPVIQVAPSGAVPLLKRLMLPQGELAQIHDSEEGLRYLAPVELRPGAVRGNHYHHFKEEWLYLMAGALNLVVEDVSSRERASFGVNAGDLVWIATGIAHTLTPTEPGYGVEFSKVRFNAGDIHPFRLV